MAAVVTIANSIAFDQGRGYDADDEEDSKCGEWLGCRRERLGSICSRVSVTHVRDE